MGLLGFGGLGIHWVAGLQSNHSKTLDDGTDMLGDLTMEDAFSTQGRLAQVSNM